MKKPLLLFLLLSAAFPALARDIDLDRIYIDRKYPRYARLASHRIEAYRKSGARFIDRQIIFVHWISADRLVYLKEFKSITIVYEYNLKNSSRREVIRLAGTVTLSSLTKDRRFIVCKLLQINGASLPTQKLSIIDWRQGTVHYKASDFPFKDFSLFPSGDGIIIEKPRGFVRCHAAAGIEQLILPSREYQPQLKGYAPRILLISPDRLNKIILGGSGGSYRTLLISRGKSRFIKGPTSSRETYWLDNERILYRSGYTGNFAVTIHNIKNGKRNRLLKGTLNSGIALSRGSRQFACLDNQVIALYDYDKNKPLFTCLEGDEISFSPSGSRFAALLYGKCFIVKKAILVRRLSDLKAEVRHLQRLYRHIASTRKYHLNTFAEIYCRKKIQSYSRALNK